MPLYNSGNCKANTYVQSLLALHIFFRRKIIPLTGITTQRVFLLFIFIFSNNDSLDHEEDADAEQTNQKKTLLKKHRAVKNQPDNFHVFHTIILGNTLNTDTIHTEKIKLPFS